MAKSSESIEDLLKKHARLLYEAAREAAEDAQTEEDVRIRMASAIDAFISSAALKIKSRHEYGLAGGRIDSKYTGVIVEYKNPNSERDRIRQKLDAHSTQRLVRQIEDRFQAFQDEEGLEKNRIYAVGTDGKYLIFIRFRNGQFEVDGPWPISPIGTERLLRAIVSLGADGESFTPDNLVRDFGSDSKLAKTGVASLYNKLVHATDPKTIVLFTEWKMLFSEVCGYDVSGQHKKVKKLAKHYVIDHARPAELLFAIHTYYAIFIKLLAAQIANTFQSFATNVVRSCAHAGTDSALKRQMTIVENGSLWAQLGIKNFLEGDLFAWYLSSWDGTVASIMRDLAMALDSYDPATLSVDPEDSRDLLKMLYQHLFPRSVRHDLGEYYTPDWLAEMTLDKLDYDGNPDIRILDPACGSGTFLLAILRRVRKWYSDNRATCGFGDRHLTEKLLANVIGFDLNPLAVMASKVNFLIAIRDLIKASGELELPVYLCDSVILPKDTGATLFGSTWHIKTSVGVLRVPAEVTQDRTILAKYTTILEESVKQRYDGDDFLARCKSESIPVEAHSDHLRLFEKCAKLEADKKNGIWARIIKNAFAPIFLGQVDFVIGNPPWVNWEHMPDDYRQHLKETWEYYGLFTLPPNAARLGGGKKDLAMLFVYACMDRFLKKSGKLGFVIVQTVFKTQGAGDGFRRFEYTANGKRWHIKPIEVEDLSKIQVFDGATNRTAVFIAEKTTKPFTYPVPYTIWRGQTRISQNTTLNEVLARTERLRIGAEPVIRNAPTSPWLTLPIGGIKIARRVIGASPYKAQAGSTTWLNGVYWVRVLRNNGKLTLVENLHDIGKIKVRKETVALESSQVVPLLRGRDVTEWSARPSAHMLLTQDAQTRTGISETIMKRSYPKLYAYLKGFEARLRKRSGYKKYLEGEPFYSIYNFGPSHLAPFKVTWRDMGSFIQCAVLASTHPVCPEHHVMFVAATSADEAHYICGALMSSIAKLVVAGYTTTTGISTHVLDVVAIPKFKGAGPQKIIAAQSRLAHAAVLKRDDRAVQRAQDQLDRAAAALWGFRLADGKVARNICELLSGGDASDVTDDESEDADEDD